MMAAGEYDKSIKAIREVREQYKGSKVLDKLISITKTKESGEDYERYEFADTVPRVCVE